MRRRTMLELGVSLAALAGCSFDRAPIQAPGIDVGPVDAGLRMDGQVPPPPPDAGVMDSGVPPMGFDAPSGA